MIRLILLCLIWSLPAAAQTVSTAAELRAALAQAVAGRVITLAAGDYGAVHWRGGRGVTLQGQGTLTGLILGDVQDVTIAGLTLAYRPVRGAPDHARPFAVTGSRGVTFQGVRIQSDATKGYGLSIDQSADVTLQGSVVSGFARGLVVQGSQNIAVLDTEFAGMRSDGMNFAAVQGVTIARNYIHDFRRDPNAGDHADMIQFWTRGTDRPSTGIRITDNLLHAGQGLWTQSIFMRNEAFEAGQAEMAYRDVTISGNMIINAHLHGITVGETAGLWISRNTLVQNVEAAGVQENPDLWTPQITVAAGATGVDISGNVVAGITAPSAQIKNNLLVQNRQPHGPGYYGAVFGADVLHTPNDPRAYLLGDQDMGAVATPAWR